MVQIFQEDSDNLNDWEDKRTKRQRSCVIPKTTYKWFSKKKKKKYNKSTEKWRNTSICYKRENNKNHITVLREASSKNFTRRLPERSSKGRKDWKGRHVIWFNWGPVVRGKCPGQGHLTQSRDEVGTPEKQEDIVELQANEVFVVNGFSTVEGKKALRIRTLLFHGTGGVVLSKNVEIHKLRKSRRFFCIMLRCNYDHVSVLMTKLQQMMSKGNTRTTTKTWVCCVKL